MYIQIAGHEFDSDGTHKFEFFLRSPRNFFIDSPLFGQIHAQTDERHPSLPFFERTQDEETGCWTVGIGRWQMTFLSAARLRQHNSRWKEKRKKAMEEPEDLGAEEETLAYDSLSVQSDP